MSAMRSIRSQDVSARLTSLVGRRRDMGAVRSLLASSRLVTLVGAGGVGKTRLAIEMTAATTTHRWDDHVFVGLGQIDHSATVAEAVHAAFAVDGHGPDSALNQLVAHIADQRLLLILDNCEHLIDACAAVAEALVRRCPGLVILATSRRHLGVVGERVYDVSPLTTPDPAVSAPPDRIARYDAVRLLVDRATAVSPDFRVTEANSAAIARLCSHLDGLPLALELAAARLRSLSVLELCNRLDDRFQLLSNEVRTAEPRQLGLRPLIDWSYDLCTTEEQMVWRRLSVLTGGFDLAAAEEVCAGDGVAGSAVALLIDRLVAQSIVVADVRGPRARFRMMETIKQYGWGLLSNDQRDALRKRHRAYFLRLATEVAQRWTGPHQETGLALLRADYPNLRTALEWSLARGDTSDALQMVYALRFHWCAGGSVSEGRRWLDRALALPAAAERERMDALGVAAWVTLLQVDHDQAAARLEQWQTLVDQLHDSASAARLLSFRGTAALFAGNTDVAVALLEKSVAQMESRGDPTDILVAQFQLVGAMATVGDPRARDIGNQALALSSRVDDRWHRSYVHFAMGLEAWLRDDLDEAEKHTHDGLVLQQNFNDDVGAISLLELRAWVSESRGQHARAAHLLGAVNALRAHIGSKREAFVPDQSRHREECARRSADALGRREWERATEAGSRLSLRESMTLALQSPTITDRTRGTRPALTRRENDVASLVAQGMTNREIADRLVISPRTVDGHVENLLAKLGFRTRSQIATWMADSS